MEAELRKYLPNVLQEIICDYAKQKNKYLINEIKYKTNMIREYLLYDIDDTEMKEWKYVIREIIDYGKSDKYICDSCDEFSSYDKSGDICDCDKKIHIYCENCVNNYTYQDSYYLIIN